jgi:Mycobacterium membrane protein
MTVAPPLRPGAPHFAHVCGEQPGRNGDIPLNRNALKGWCTGDSTDGLPATSWCQFQAGDSLGSAAFTWLLPAEDASYRRSMHDPRRKTNGSSVFRPAVAGSTMEVLMAVFAVAAAGFPAHRLSGICGSHDLTSDPSGAANDIVPFSPKRVVRGLGARVQK